MVPISQYRAPNMINNTRPTPRTLVMRAGARSRPEYLDRGAVMRSGRWCEPQRCFQQSRYWGGGQPRNVHQQTGTKVKDQHRGCGRKAEQLPVVFRVGGVGVV